MGTTENVQAWSTTAADNDDADLGINWTEGQLAASVNNSARGMMAAVKKLTLDLSGSPSSVGGTADAHVVTTNQSISSAHLTQGFRICYPAPATNTTTTPTVAIDGLSAKTIRRADGVAVAVGQLSANMILDLVYQSSAGEFWAANITASSAAAEDFDIIGLDPLLSVDVNSDAIPIYDASATANKRTAARYFAPSYRASFSAQMSGDQLMASASATAVSLGIEAFDVGSYYSAGWTPPAGTCLMSAGVTVTGVASGDEFKVSIYKDGAVHKSVAFVATGASTIGEGASLTVVDQCNGSNVYKVYIDSQADTSFTILSAADKTWFTGTMI